MSDHHEEAAPATGYDRRLMRRLLRYVVPHTGAVVLSSVAMFAAAGVELLQPWFTQQAIDRFIAGGDLPGLTRMAAFFLGLLVVGFAAEYAQTAVLQLTGQRIMHTLRTEVYTHLQRLDLAFYDRNPVGRLMTRVTTDVDALNELFATGVVTVFGDLVVLAGITVAMVVLDWRLALVAFSVVPFILWVAQWFRTRVHEFYRQVRGLVARLNAFLQEHITGMATVQVFNQEARTLQRFEAINRRHRDVNVNAIFYYAVFYPQLELPLVAFLAWAAP
jgi:ATP-binding cassette subfamily B protein